MGANGLFKKKKDKRKYKYLITWAYEKSKKKIETLLIEQIQTFS